MNPTNRVKLYIIFLLGLFYCLKINSSIVSYTILSINENKKTSFKITVKNSLGNPQTNVFLKITGKSDEFRPDSCGVISFEYEIPETYKRNANIYINSNPEESVKTFVLDESNVDATFKIDTKEEVLDFKKSNNFFSIEGIVTNPDGEPVEGAIVSIQGTGRTALTDEIGLFKIDADYNHNIIIRADGMENITMNLSRFLANPNEAFNIKMYPKNGNKIYSSVENMPEFPGGMKFFKRYIDSNLVYPETAKKNKIEGVVVMQFVVEKDGDISNEKIMRRLHPELDSVALNLIRNMPKWKPASDHGIIVRCKYSVPIAFKVPVPKPVLPEKDSLSVKADSIILNDSILKKDSIIMRDSTIISDTILKKDSVVMRDSTIINDTIIKNDSIKADSTNIEKVADTKVKKRNIFVRFFRWLFGIKDKEEENNNK